MCKFKIDTNSVNGTSGKISILCDTTSTKEVTLPKPCINMNPFAKCIARLVPIVENALGMGDLTEEEFLELCTFDDKGNPISFTTPCKVDWNYIEDNARRIAEEEGFSWGI